MTFQSLTDRFLHDLKASWQKSIVLGVLLVVGLVFWVPPLLRATGSDSKASAAASTADSSSTQLSPEAPADITSAASASGNVSTPAVSWKNADRFLQSDPLVRSVQVAAIQGDPFRVDQDQFPPPILFAEEPVEEIRPNADQNASAATDLRVADGLVLKSTIVGVRRRAAFINSKLYFEGAEVQVNGQAYRLASVHPKKVVLIRGKEVFELKIAARSQSGSIELQQRTPSP